VNSYGLSILALVKYDRTARAVPSNANLYKNESVAPPKR
jgi:hypothetical protein